MQRTETRPAMENALLFVDIICIGRFANINHFKTAPVLTKYAIRRPTMLWDLQSDRVVNIRTITTELHYLLLGKGTPRVQIVGHSSRDHGISSHDKRDC